MELPIIAIGNSKGIRLPKTILSKYNIEESIDLVEEKNYIILKPRSAARKGWDTTFKKAGLKMSKDKTKSSILPDVFADENFEEWK